MSYAHVTLCLMAMCYENNNTYIKKKKEAMDLGNWRRGELSIQIKATRL